MNGYPFYQNSNGGTNCTDSYVALYNDGFGNWNIIFTETCSGECGCGDDYSTVSGPCPTGSYSGGPCGTIPNVCPLQTFVVTSPTLTCLLLGCP